MIKKEKSVAKVFLYKALLFELSRENIIINSIYIGLIKNKSIKSFGAPLKELISTVNIPLRAKIQKI